MQPTEIFGVRRTLLSLLLLTLLASCGNSKKSSSSGPEAVIELQLIDSLVVNELSTLAIDDYSPDTGYYLIKGTKTRKVYLVDEKGTIIKEYDLLNDGPNGLGTNGAFGYRFLDGNRWIAQGRSNGYHIYNLQGEKLKTAPDNHLGLFRMTVYTFRTTFTPYLKNGVTYIVGEEPNSFNPAEYDPKNADASFYEEVRTVFNYNLDTEENELLETYPESWHPRQNNYYVGPSLPLVAFDAKKEKLAVLPVTGNQLFVYDYSDSVPIIKDVVELTHRFRPEVAPVFDPDDEINHLDYPEFSDLRILGDYILVGFYTKIPKDIIRQLRSKSEQYYGLPEYKTAQKQYNKAYYLLVKDGKQVGILDKFPVHGNLDFTDANGYLYINDNTSPETERNYNVFYKLKIKE